MPLFLLGIFSELLSVPVILHYLCMSLALFLIARDRGVMLSWLAWLPIGQDYVLGAIADEIGGRDRFFGDRPSSYRHILACVGIVNLFINGMALLLTQRNAGFPVLFDRAQGRLLSTVAEVATFAISVVTIYVLYKIFLFYCHKRSAIDTLLCVFIPFIEPILLLVECYIIPRRSQSGRGGNKWFH